VIQDWEPHLGRKVSLRYRLTGGSHPFSEAIGVVANVSTGKDGQTITILTRRGESKTIPTGDILAAKLFPLG
jgi:hypothetical protein